MLSQRVAVAWGEIQAARNYTLRLLDDLTPDDWFFMPQPGVTHIAWQVGHLAMAQYRLALERIRGTRPDDTALISPDEIKLFGKGSTPDRDPARYPPPEQLRNLINRIYQRAGLELSELPDAECDAPPHAPHPLFNTKLGSLFWCARHEMMHAGQIGLVRRLMGRAPLW